MRSIFRDIKPPIGVTDERDERTDILRPDAALQYVARQKNVQGV